MENESSRKGPGKTAVTLTVNGHDYEIFIEPRRTLLDALRKDIGLTGTKKGCHEGTCGACTVIINGNPAYACMILAVECAGKPIETIESMEKEGQLHPIQRAFIEADAFQCGFCTSGQIMSTKALLDLHPDPAMEEIKDALSGNLCRCGAYPKILKAVRIAAVEMRGEAGEKEGN